MPLIFVALVRCVHFSNLLGREGGWRSGPGIRGGCGGGDAAVAAVLVVIRTVLTAVMVVLAPVPLLAVVIGVVRVGRGMQAVAVSLLLLLDWNGGAVRLLFMWMRRRIVIVVVAGTRGSVVLLVLVVRGQGVALVNARMMRRM